MTMDRNALAHTLVCFFIAHGAIIPFLDCLVSQEVQQTRECVCMFVCVCVCVLEMGVV